MRWDKEYTFESVIGIYSNFVELKVVKEKYVVVASEICFINSFLKTLI